MADRLRRDVLAHLFVGGLALTGAELIGVQLGWVTQIAALVALALYGVAMILVTGWSLDHRPHDRFGPANKVTLARCLIACAVGGLVAEPNLSDAALWSVIAVSLGFLALDGVDGRLARKSGFASAFGGRFDMETDALMGLVLSALLVSTGRVGVWVLAIGLMRHGFVVAGRVWPALTGALPQSVVRQGICVAQELLLIFALTPGLAARGVTGAAALALVITAYSFGIDCVRLLRRSSRLERA